MTVLPTQHRSRTWSAWVALAGGLLATLAVVASLHDRASRRDAYRFDEAVDSTRKTFDHAIATTHDELRSLCAFVRSSEVVTAEEFAFFSDRSGRSAVRGGVLAVGYAEFVPQGGEAAHFAGLRRTGVWSATAAADVRPSAGERGLRVVHFRRVPETGNGNVQGDLPAALVPGVDLLGCPELRRTLSSEFPRDAVVTTGRIEPGCPILGRGRSSFLFVHRIPGATEQSPDRGVTFALTDERAYADALARHAAHGILLIDLHAEPSAGDAEDARLARIPESPPAWVEIGEHAARFPVDLGGLRFRCDANCLARTHEESQLRMEITVLGLGAAFSLGLWVLLRAEGNARRRAEETARALAESRAEVEERGARLDEMARTIRDVFWIADLRTRRLLYVSPAFGRIWGGDAPDAAAAERVWKESIHPEDAERTTHAGRFFAGPVPYDETYRIRRADGTERWIRERGYPVRDAAGDVVRSIGIAEDVTEIRQKEQELRQASESLTQSQKMEALGTLASGIAHDFNNLLTVIRGYADISLRDPRLHPEIADCVQAVVESSERAAVLTRQLLAFTRKQATQTEIVDLNRILEESEALLRPLLREDIEIEISQGTDLRTISADPGQIVQVLLNLSTNARDAMAGGGKLTIATANAPEGAPDAAHFGGPSGPAVRLSVSDTGCGMDETVLSRIWEPFFTTKEVGKGTGLGLPTVWGIVQKSGGSVRVRSAPGKGTTFDLYFPVTTAAEIAPAAEEVEALPTEGRETVLVVEDDDAVRNFTTAVLRGRGFRVLSAENGAAAIQTARHADYAVDVVVTDMVMPGMSGRDLATALSLRRPTMRFLFVSGYTEDENILGGTLGPLEAFLQKPFLPEALARKVREVLDRPADGAPGSPPV